MSSNTRSSNINIPKRERSHSISSVDGARERSLSENFESLSYNSKQVIMSMCGGAKPTSTARDTDEGYRRPRFDSTELSPVTMSILQFHGMKNR